MVALKPSCPYFLWSSPSRVWTEERMSLRSRTITGSFVVVLKEVDGVVDTRVFLFIWTAKVTPPSATGSIFPKASATSFRPA